MYRITSISFTHIKPCDFLITQVLNGGNRRDQGGIVLFMTDGEDTCGDHSWPNHDLENQIVKDKVRVITLALG